MWILAMLLPIVAYLTLTASGIGWDQWGGLQLNLFLTLAGVVFAFPLGILLALGRRSSLPVVKGISVTYIELIRGVPLITLLLLGVFALGFFCRWSFALRESPGFWWQSRYSRPPTSPRLFEEVSRRSRLARQKQRHPWD